MSGEWWAMLPGAAILDVEKLPSVTEQVAADPEGYWRRVVAETDGDAGS